MFGNGSVGNLETCYDNLVPEVFFKELAIQSCVNLIANAVARGEFVTYQDGKQVRADNYYLFNVEPNQNQNASKFWRDVIHKLVYNNECLVIQSNDYLYVADTFSINESAFYGNTYSEISIANLSLSKTFEEPEVLHFELHDQKIKILLEGLYKLYGDLIAYSKNTYKKSNAKRGVLNIPTSYPQTKKAQEDLQLLLNERFEKFFKAEGGAMLPLSNDLTYTDMSTSGYKTGSDSRDIRALIDDVFDYVAIAFQIPPALLKGQLADTDKAMNTFLTLCVNPIAELISDEINRKMYRKVDYLKRTYVKLDTTRIKAVDLKDIAGSLDILTRIGVYTIDDCLEALGMEPIRNEWSTKRWMTKNYEGIEELVNSLKGGE